MGCEVYANNNAIACKAGDSKVIAAFPDVCLSPPSPPAGPVPVPYPNTSFSKDMKNGSKTVKIKKKEVMLKDKSFYKTSPLGDEAATRSFGANVITHVITGKTYFNAWSMDVKFEGHNVDRHIDITTSNHASPPPGDGTPIPDQENGAKKEKEKCANCEEHHENLGTYNSKGDQTAAQVLAGQGLGTFRRQKDVNENDFDNKTLCELAQQDDKSSKVIIKLAKQHGPKLDKLKSSQQRGRH